MPSSCAKVELEGITRDVWSGYMNIGLHDINFKESALFFTFIPAKNGNLTAPVVMWL